MISEVVQSFSAPAAFDLKFLSYNDKAPFISIDFGKYNFILELV